MCKFSFGLFQADSEVAALYYFLAGVTDRSLDLA